MNRNNNTLALTIITALAVAALIIALFGQSEQPTTPKAKTLTTKVDTSGATGTQTGSVQVPAPVVAGAASGLESGLRDETPQGMTPNQTQAVQQATNQIKATLPPLPTAGATAGVPGCRTQFVVNQSSRHGVRPTQFWLHYTVSPNRPGWSDVEAIVNLFNHVSSQASSNFVLDGEGHCAYIVPIEDKAWTQAASNPFAVSVEVIDTGHETTYLAPAGLKELRTIVQTVSQRTGIPIRRGRVSNCTPVVSGIVNHDDGGICSGGHVDITPFSVDTVIKQIQAGLRTPKKVTWVRHRQQVHITYQKDCKTRAQRKSHAKECAALRVRARQLDALIKR